MSLAVARSEQLPIKCFGARHARLQSYELLYGCKVYGVQSA